MKEAFRQLAKLNWGPEIFELGIKNILDISHHWWIPAHITEGCHVEFSFHGLPISHVKRSDKTGLHCQMVNDSCQKRTDANKCAMHTIAI